MNWKDSFLGCCTALCLSSPLTQTPAVAKPQPDTAAQESDRRRFRDSQSLPLGQPNLAELRTSTSLAPGVTYTVRSCAKEVWER